MSETTPPYRLLGLDISPYTMKVKAYFIFKTIPFEWVQRNRKNEKLFQEHAKVQLIPMVFMPDGTAIQDSTLIMEQIEAAHPDRSMYPDDPVLRFVSDLLEEFGDEWCNKLMFLPRWFYRADQIATSGRIAAATLEGSWYRPLAKPLLAKFLVRRMKPRLSFAGANETNRPHLEAGLKSFADLLNAHLESRSYLLGERPSFGDFGIYGNLYQAWTDPTAGGYIKSEAPRVDAWIRRMTTPEILGDFETLETLRPTLMPILRDEVGDKFLKWSVANDKAWSAKEPETSLEINGAPWRQKTFKYHSISLGELRKKYHQVSDNAALDSFLDEAGCLQYLVSE